MSAVISPQKESSDADQQYRSLAALDSRRPGEWVRRKVQAYAAQQAAERALRKTVKAEGPSAPVATPTPAPRVAPAAAGSGEARDPPKKPWLLPAALGAVGAAVIIGIILIPHHSGPVVTAPPP